jgi:hypothetical protein
LNLISCKIKEYNAIIVSNAIIISKGSNPVTFSMLGSDAYRSKSKYISNRPSYYDKLNAYHIEFKTEALTSLRIPKIIDYYSDVEPDMVLNCIILGNACGWVSYEIACG